MKRSTVQSCLAAPFFSLQSNHLRPRRALTRRDIKRAKSRRRIASLDQGTTRYRREGAVGHILFDRPQARNAMTWAMYDELAAICQQVNAEPGLRAVTLRGAGGKAFIAGTDIAQFAEFRTGEDGIAYEARGEGVPPALEAFRLP